MLDIVALVVMRGFGKLSALVTNGWRAAAGALLAGVVGLLLLAAVASADPNHSSSSGQARAASGATPYSIALNYTIRF